jgi:hypothetical protein
MQRVARLSIWRSLHTVLELHILVTFINYSTWKEFFFLFCYILPLRGMFHLIGAVNRSIRKIKSSFFSYYHSPACFYAYTCVRFCFTFIFKK